MKDIVIASSNVKKIQELQAIMSEWTLIPQNHFDIQDADETGLTFIENALIKARHASLQSNKPALADDSGLVVPAINHAPGIFSSRFAGDNASDDDNMNLLLEKMNHLSLEKQRVAYFYCVIVLINSFADPIPLFATGKLEGYILKEKKGDGGFGYDPVFYIPSHRCTMAQLSTKIKNEISHRAIALQRLKAALNSI